MLKKDQKDPKHLPLGNLEALWKQKVKAKAKLEATWLNVEGMPQHSHRTSQQRLGDFFGSRH